MPNLRIPRRSSQHRFAAIALYRALLAQCRAVPIAETQRSELQNIIRNRFKQAQHSASSRYLRVSFEAGYEAVDHLDAAAAGDSQSLEYLTSLLERAPSKTKLAKAVPAKPVKRSEEGSDEDGYKYVKRSLFDRPIPLEQLSGKRNVPVLFNANGFPVLRIKKPQPESLSRYIRQRIEQRHAWHERRQRLYEDYTTATREDEWDRILAQAHGVSPSGEPNWRRAVDAAIDEVHGKLDQMKVKNRVMAEKMQAVVDREQELFEKEALERKARKRQEKFQQRQAKKMSTLQDTTEENGAATAAHG